MKFHFVLLAVLIAWAITGCKFEHPTVPQPTPESIATPSPSPVVVNTNSDVTFPLVLSEMPWKARAENAEWSSFLYERIKQSSLPKTQIRDASVVCPKYSKRTEQERAIFWTHLISKMAQYESGFDPKTSYKESFKDSTGTNVISRGLLQLSNESARGYKCLHKTAADLYDPKINLDCMVRILEKWVPKDSVAQGKSGDTHLGAGRYHSVMRLNSGSHPKIVAYTKSLGVCAN